MDPGQCEFRELIVIEPRSRPGVNAMTCLTIGREARSDVID